MIILVDPQNTTHQRYMNEFTAYSFPTTFRYFERRKWNEVIHDHIITLLYIINDKAVGYAHIDFDRESQRYYFGVCVMDEFQGKGIGKELLFTCIQKAKEKKLTLFLTVDKSNVRAFSMYKKYGFYIDQEKPTYYLMKLEHPKAE